MGDPSTVAKLGKVHGEQLIKINLIKIKLIKIKLIKINWVALMIQLGKFVGGGGGVVADTNYLYTAHWGWINISKEL